MSAGETPFFDLTRYNDFPEFESYIRGVARMNPDIVQMRLIGFSREHRPLLGLKVVRALAEYQNVCVRSECWIYSQKIQETSRNFSESFDIYWGRSADQTWINHFNQCWVPGSRLDTVIRSRYLGLMAPPLHTFFSSFSFFLLLFTNLYFLHLTHPD